MLRGARKRGGILASVVGSVLFTAAVGGYLAMLVATSRTTYALTDISVYRDVGIALLHHHRGALYTREFGTPPLPYLYTPYAALGLAALSPLSLSAWKLLLTTANIACVVAVAWASLRLAGVRGRGHRVGLTLAFAAVGLWLEPVQRTLSFGQINLVILALVALDLATMRRWRLGGVATGVAAGIKLTPLLLIPYLWFTGRRREAVTATATFAVTIGVGFVFLPADSLRYWSGSGFQSARVEPQRLVNQSAVAAIRRLAFGHPHADSASLAVAALIGLLGLSVAVLTTRRGHELAGFVVAGVTGLLVSPISWTHHWVFVVPALALGAAHAWLPSRGGRVAFAAIVVAAFAAWPARLSLTGHWDSASPISAAGLLRFTPHDGVVEYHWHGWRLVTGNYYVLWGLLLILFAATRLWTAGDSACSRQRSGILWRP